MQPFFAHEFAYRWSYLDAFNTAVLRLFSQSNTSSIIINHARRTQTPYAFFPTLLHTYLLPANFYRLPCAFFDPIWLAVDGGDPKAQQEWKIKKGTLEGFKDPSLKLSEISRRGLHVFDGAFTFHYHSSSTIPMPEVGSYLYQWNQFLASEVHDTFHTI
jgi:WD repeat and SOF domain-containing protein 1